MPPAERVVPRFAAEPPQELLPYGRWAVTLREAFLSACTDIDAEGDELGEPQSIVWFPDRTWEGRTFIPATTRTTEGFEIFGYVAFTPGEGTEAADFYATADFTEETAERNPEWRMDLNDDVVGAWRGEQGKVAHITLVWGVPLVPGGAIVTAELADLVVDQCVVMEDRFTLLAPDAYRGDYLDIKLWNARGEELATESLYVSDEEDEEARPVEAPESRPGAA
jgi:hypothetical protein